MFQLCFLFNVACQDCVMRRVGRAKSLLVRARAIRPQHTIVYIKSKVGLESEKHESDHACFIYPSLGAAVGRSRFQVANGRPWLTICHADGPRDPRTCSGSLAPMWRFTCISLDWGFPRRYRQAQRPLNCRTFRVPLRHLGSHEMTRIAWPVGGRLGWCVPLPAWWTSSAQSRDD
jgi:hypothetical protein